MCPLFDVVHPAFLLLTMALPTLQGAMKDSFEAAITACDMPKTSEFPSLDNCQKRFLRTHKEVDLAQHPVISTVLQEGSAKKVSSSTWF